MRGTAYAITEIVVFLAIATVIGVAIGWALSRMRAPVRTRSAAATDRSKELEDRVKRLEAEKLEIAQASPDVEELRKELSQAQWQIKALEDALADDVPG